MNRKKELNSQRMTAMLSNYLTLSYIKVLTEITSAWYLKLWVLICWKSLKDIIIKE